jgi:DNA-binding PadR family transcriptional regulator
VLAERFAMDSYDWSSKLWPALDLLVRHGLVERLAVEDQRERSWRKTQEGAAWSGTPFALLNTLK